METEEVNPVLRWARRTMAGQGCAPLERGYRYQHGVRVGRIAVWLGRALGLDEAMLGRLYVAGVLHDVGKSGYRGKEPHGPRGGRIVRTVLRRWLAAEEREEIARMVEHHYARPRSRWYAGKEKPQWPDGILIIQDADVLDHHGAMYFASCLRYAQNEDIPAEQFFRTFWNSPEERVERTEAMRSLNFTASRTELRRRFDEARRLMRKV